MYIIKRIIWITKEKYSILRLRNTFERHGKKTTGRSERHTVLPAQHHKPRGDTNGDQWEQGFESVTGLVDIAKELQKTVKSFKPKAKKLIYQTS